MKLSLHLITYIIPIFFIINLTSNSLFLFAIENVNLIENIDNITNCDVEYNNIGELLTFKCTGTSQINKLNDHGIRDAKLRSLIDARSNMSQFLHQRITSRETLETMVNHLITKTGDNSKTTLQRITIHTQEISARSDSLLKGMHIEFIKVDAEKMSVFTTVRINLSDSMKVDQIKSLMGK